MNSDIGKTEYDSFALIFIESIYQPINLASESGWYKLPCIVNQEAQTIVALSTQSLFTSRITITSDRFIRKWPSALPLVGKQILPPTFEELETKAVEVKQEHVPFMFKQGSPSQLGFTDVEYKQLWSGKIYETPTAPFADLYKLFRDITVKACPDLFKQGTPLDVDVNSNSDCPTC